MSRRTTCAGILAAALVATLGLQEAQAKNRPGKNCKYDLDVSGSGSGSAEATIKPRQLQVKIRDAEPRNSFKCVCGSISLPRQRCSAARISGSTRIRNALRLATLAPAC